jgi:hypothetical protein
LSRAPSAVSRKSTTESARTVKTPHWCRWISQMAQESTGWAARLPNVMAVSMSWSAMLVN